MNCIPATANAQNELFGNDRLVEALNKNPDLTPEEMLPAVREDINKFVGDAPQFDDITMLSLRYAGPSFKSVAEV